MFNGVRRRSAFHKDYEISNKNDLKRTHRQTFYVGHSKFSVVKILRSRLTHAR